MNRTEAGELLLELDEVAGGGGHGGEIARSGRFRYPQRYPERRQ